MKADLFSNKFPSEKQKDVATFFLNRLRSMQESSIACEDYASSVALAHMISRFDKERLCAVIHIHSTWVRIIRNEKGAFAFPCTTFDHTIRTLGIESEPEERNGMADVRFETNSGQQTFGVSEG